MTRESKLALIVGFGLVLFVGILVSDHFSAGQRQEAAHLLAQRGGARPHESPISIQSLQPVPANDVQNVRANDPPAPPVAHDGLDDRAAETAGLSGSSSGEIARNDGHGPGEIGFAPKSGHTSAERREPPRIGPGPTSVTGESETTMSTKRDDGTAARTTPVDPTGADVKLYPVKEGETLYSICSAHYGDAALWQALAQFNKSAVPNPARMRKGVTLRLPPIEVLKPSAAAGKSPANASAPDAGSGSARGETHVKRASDAMPPRDSTSSYTVKRGETLVRIAEKTLGSSSRWEEIAKLNKDLISDPHAIAPGMVIRVPQG